MTSNMIYILRRHSLWTAPYLNVKSMLNIVVTSFWSNCCQNCVLHNFVGQNWTKKKQTLCLAMKWLSSASWKGFNFNFDFHLILKPQKLQNCLNFVIMSIECLMTPSSTPSWLLSKEIGYDFSADTSTYNAAVSLLRPLSQQFHHFISLYFTSLHSIALGAGYSKISPIHTT